MKLTNHPEIEQRLGVSPDKVIVDRNEWEEVAEKINFSPASLIKRMLIGAAIGLFIISFFVFQVDEPDPDWGKFWMIRPLIITPLAGAFGILAFYLKQYVRPKSDLWKFIVLIVSFIAFIIALWLGTVLGLDGTLWN